MLITQGHFCKRCHGDLNTLQEKMREVSDSYEDEENGDS